MYQLVADLVTGKEIEPLEFTLGHRLLLEPFANAIPEPLDSILSREFDAIKQAQFVLKYTNRNKLIDFIAIPVTPDGAVNNKLNISAVNDIANKISEEFPSSDIGIYLSTELLSAASSGQVDEIIELLSNFFMRTSEDDKKIFHVLIATNVFTITAATRVHEWANKSSHNGRLFFYLFIITF